MGYTTSLLGLGVLALLAAGYLGQKYLPPPKPSIVGIDLGTTYSCVGAYQSGSGTVNVLSDSSGRKCIPSVVAFTTQGKVLVGFEALEQAENNPQNTLYDAKRFIGRKFSPPEFSKEAARYPFRTRLQADGSVRFLVTFAGKELTLTAEDVGSYILRELRNRAEAVLGKTVTKAIMSVPAEFDLEQRNATKRAAALVGLSVLRVINEPTAAALAYGLHKKPRIENVMVIDLGGGTLDVSLLQVQGGLFLTEAMSGNSHLGGQDFNQRLLDYLRRELEEETGHRLIDAEDQQVLRLAVEEAKLNLTNMQQTELRVPIRSFHTTSSSRTSDSHSLNSFTFQRTLTRTEFESINQDLFLKLFTPVGKVLHVAALKPHDVDEIVLVGGSTRIPRIRQLVRDYFRKAPNVRIDPDEAVTHGVSLQAGITSGAWPLTVSAIELPTQAKKVLVN